MANVSMWWAQTTWSTEAPGLSMTFGPTGIGVSGTVTGPGGIPLGLRSAGYATLVTSVFWSGPDYYPPTGCEWQSLATDMTTGSVTAVTFGGVQPFGPWPQSLVSVVRRYRVFSGGTLLFEEQPRVDSIISVLDQYTTQTASLPLGGVFHGFSSKTFDFDRTKGLAIELQVKLWIYLQGGGTVTFSGVNVALPQFEIRSTL
jgi:hypothetical protein